MRKSFVLLVAGLFLIAGCSGTGHDQREEKRPKPPKRPDHPSNQVVLKEKEPKKLHDVDLDASIAYFYEFYPEDTRLLSVTHLPNDNGGMVEIVALTEREGVKFVVDETLNIILENSYHIKPLNADELANITFNREDYDAAMSMNGAQDIALKNRDMKYDVMSLEKNSDLLVYVFNYHDTDSHDVPFCIDAYEGIPIEINPKSEGYW